MNIIYPTNDELKSLEDSAVAFAIRAKDLLEKNLGNKKIKYKGDGFSNPVTNVDLEIEKYLRSEILKRFPHHTVIGEEYKNDTSKYSDFIWIIDPIDGTSNFVAGLSIYSISIGLFFKGDPIVGVMFSPFENIGGGIYHSRRGGGSFLEGNKLAVMNIGQPVSSNLIGIPLGYRRAGLFGKRTYDIGNVRITGSISVEMLMVARGVFQHSFFSHPKIWDVAAGIVIVREAGGEILRFKNNHWEPLGNFTDDLLKEPGEGYLEGLRNWSHPLLVGNAGLLEYITAKGDDAKISLKSGIVQMKKLFHKFI